MLPGMAAANFDMWSPAESVIQRDANILVLASTLCKTLVEFTRTVF